MQAGSDGSHWICTVDGQHPLNQLRLAIVYLPISLFTVVRHPLGSWPDCIHEAYRTAPFVYPRSKPGGSQGAVRSACEGVDGSRFNFFGEIQVTSIRSIQVLLLVSLCWQNFCILLLPVSVTLAVFAHSFGHLA